MNAPTPFVIGPETTRLLHRAFTVADAEAFYELNSNAAVMRHTGETPLASLQAARRALENYPDFKSAGYGRWACIHKNSQTIIGFCGLKHLPEFNTTDVGFRFLPRYWGLGLATEACIATLDFGFNKIGLDRISAFVIPENIASIRVLEKSGMKLESEFDYDGISTLRFVADNPSGG